MNDDFVFVDEFVPGIRWDAKYATWDNFTGKPVDGYAANRIAGTKALCAALEGAREKAASLGFGLLLWDGYRPQREEYEIILHLGGKTMQQKVKAGQGKIVIRL